MIASFSVYAQGTFQNLDFESATPGTPITGPILGASYQPTGLALPGWTAYIGSDKQSEVVQNSYGEGEAEIDLFGPNYPAAGNLPSAIPGTIDGNYSVLLQAGGDPQTGLTTSVSIAQTGAVPLGSASITFEAWQTPFTQFTVSLGGDTLSTFILATGDLTTRYTGRASHHPWTDRRPNWSSLPISVELEQVGWAWTTSPFPPFPNPVPSL